MISKKSKNQKIINYEKFKFLSDAPLTADQKQYVRFRHISIVENLKQIIINCPAPFTIGLFSKWGTGKSTILNLLKESLKNENKFISIASVDVWKYEGDSLRRQFLITLDKELELKLKYEDELNQTLTVSDPTKGPLEFDWGILLNIYGIIACLFIVLGIVFDISEGVPASLFSFGLFKRVSVNIIEHRTDSAESFEKRFNDDILGHKKLKKKKLLIIIDNLERAAMAD